MPLVPVVMHPQVVVEAHDIESLRKVCVKGSIDGSRAEARGIEFVRPLNHGIKHAHALRLMHHCPLFVAHRPQNDRQVSCGTA